MSGLAVTTNKPHGALVIDFLNNTVVVILVSHQQRLLINQGHVTKSDRLWTSPNSGSSAIYHQAHNLGQATYILDA